MKVLLVDQFGKTTGRDTLAVAELINKNENIDMEVYLSDNTEIPDNRKYTVKIVKGFHGAYNGSIINKVINYLKALHELKSYIIMNRINIVHLQWFSLPWIEWIYVAQLHKYCKVFITVHDIIPFDNRPAEIKFLDKIYKRADTLFIHTKSGKRLFHENYSAKTPVKVITQGFCMKQDYKRIDNFKAKEYFGIPHDRVVFLYYGTIRQSKGFDYLISAIHEAYKKNNKVYLLAAGAFHSVNENEYRNLVINKLSKDYSTVNFGFVPQNKEQWYFSAADVLCLPYLEVTQSGVAQLGLMYELPIIATNIAEMPDVARDGINGTIIQPGDTKQLENAILDYASNDKARKEHSIASKVLGETEFSLEVKAQKIAEVYKS